MSGRHARIFSSIWQDEDFRLLSRDHQRLYLFLLSQANVTHLGVLPLTLKRWVKSCADYTVEALQDDLAALAAERYVVVDEESEEVLIRSMLRRDGVYKQPNVLLSAINSASGVDSPEIRQVLVSEIDRIDVDAEIRDDSKGSAEGKRKAAKEGLQRLRRDLGDTPWDPSPNPSGNPSPGVDRTHNVRATRAAPSPTPSPTPPPKDVCSPASPSSVLALVADTGPSPDVLFEQWYAVYPRHKAKEDARKAFKAALKRATFHELMAGADRVRATPNRVDEFTPYPASWLRAGQWADEPDVADDRPMSHADRRAAWQASDSYDPSKEWMYQ